MDRFWRSALVRKANCPDFPLYLFYDSGYAEAFETNAKEWVAKADGNWPTVEARLLAQ